MASNPSTTSLSQEQLDSIASALQLSINAHLESLLNERFATLKDSFEERWLSAQKEGWEKTGESMTTLFRSNLPDELRRVLPSIVPSTPNHPEPPILADCHYPGGHPSLRGFIHVIRDTLSSRSTSFPSDPARINWVARHFKPIGSSSNNWWMSLLQENASAQGVLDHYQFSGLPFIIPALSTLDFFIKALVDEFGDKLAHETALKNLQDCRMGNLKIGDFHSHFKSLATLVPDAPESIRIDYYKKALSPSVRRQAILRADWEPAKTLAAKMAIAILAAQQLDEVNGSSHTKPTPLPRNPQIVQIPQDTDAMEVDVISLSASNPSNFPRKFYINECKRQSLCTRCLSSYNDSHRSPTGAATCPNAAASLQNKIEFLKVSKKNMLPRSVPPPASGPPQPVQRAVAAVAPSQPLPQQAQTYPHPIPWGHPYPPFQYGYPPHLPPPHSTYTVPSPPAQPIQPTASVLAVFSEYSDIYSPRYYDLPGANYPSDGQTSQVTELDPGLPADTTSVSAMTFTGSSGSDSRLILSVMLLVGKRLIRAKALIDSGSGGNFISSTFAEEHSLSRPGNSLSSV